MHFFRFEYGLQYPQAQKMLLPVRANQESGAPNCGLTYECNKVVRLILPETSTLV